LAQTRTRDQFLADQLRPERLEAVAREQNFPLELRIQPGYDHQQAAIPLAPRLAIVAQIGGKGFLSPRHFGRVDDWVLSQRHAATVGGTLSYVRLSQRGAAGTGGG
jgi:hypothetical protein